MIGAGKRVVEDALPALNGLGETATLAGVFARGAKTITSGGREYAVEALDALTRELENPTPAAVPALPETAGVISGTTMSVALKISIMHPTRIRKKFNKIYLY